MQIFPWLIFLVKPEDRMFIFCLVSPVELFSSEFVEPVGVSDLRSILWQWPRSVIKLCEEKYVLTLFQIS